MPDDEYIADRIHDLIYRSLPVGAGDAVLGPLAALDELAGWVRDDHQWVDGRAQNWISLLDEVLDTWRSLPHAVNTLAASTDAAALASLAKARGRIATDKGAFDVAVRAALTSAASDLVAVLATPDALTAAWMDLARAVKRSDFRREKQAIALLASVAELQGKLWQPLSRRLWGVLGDDLNEIRAIRAQAAGQATPALVAPGAAGESATSRLSLAQQTLSLPAPSGDLIVWLAFVRAHVDRIVVPVGPAVTLFEGRWLRNVLEHCDDAAHPHDSVPAEVAASRDVCLKAWEADRPDVDFALMRIELGTVAIEAALDEARTTAAALIRLAAFYDRGRTSWRDSGSYVIFVDGEPDWWSAGIHDLADDRDAVLNRAFDQTAATLSDLAATIGPHLPVSDPEVRTALDLLQWLTEARGSWSPAALLLDDRVLQTAAGWSEYADSRRFAEEQLALAWAFQQAQSEIADTGIKAVDGIDRSGGLTPSDPTRRAASLEATDSRHIVTRDWPAGPHAHLSNVVTQIAWLQGWQERGTDARLRLAVLQKHTTSGQAAARWLEQLRGEFGVLLDRANRTRNAIAHGGPISEPTLRTIGRFFDEVASDALNRALQARLSGQRPRAVFDQRRRDLELILDDLANGRVAPAKGLSALMP